MTHSPKLINMLVAGAVVALLASCSEATAPAATPTASATTTASQPTPTMAPTPTATRLRVADLMDKAGCKGGVIGTQLYSYETGRCTLAGAEVTIAVFDTAALRDQWLAVGRQFGGTFVAGEGWAAGVAKPGPAGTLAGLLGGKVV